MSRLAHPTLLNVRRLRSGGVRAARGQRRVIAQRGTIGRFSSLMRSSLTARRRPDLGASLCDRPICSPCSSLLTETSIFEIRVPAVTKMIRFCIHDIDTHVQYWKNSMRLDRSDTAMHAVESLGDRGGIAAWIPCYVRLCF